MGIGVQPHDLGTPFASPRLGRLKQRRAGAPVPYPVVHDQGVHRAPVVVLSRRALYCRLPRQELPRWLASLFTGIRGRFVHFT